MNQERNNTPGLFIKKLDSGSDNETVIKIIIYCHRQLEEIR